MFLDFIHAFNDYSVSHMFVSHTCIFAVIYTSTETSPHVCIGKPCICRVPACIVGLQLAITRLEHLEAFQAIIFIWAYRMDQN